MTGSDLGVDFEPVARDEWIAAAEKTLRGRTLESLASETCEGISIDPMSAPDSGGGRLSQGLPGQFPFLRGTRADGYRSQPWLIAQGVAADNPQDFNRALKGALAAGATAIALDQGLPLDSAADLRLALAGIDLARAPLLMAGGPGALTTGRLLRESLGADDRARLRGCIGYDPLHDLAQFGGLDADAYDRMLSHFRTLDDACPGLGSIAVRTDIYHEAGANAVQELAIALATAVETLREMAARGIEPNLLAGKLHFFLSIGENFFMEIAKLRAIKWLWAQVLRACGADHDAQKIRLHARAGRRSKTQLDAHVNILRGTAEALAAAMAGVDSLRIDPFDAPLGKSDAFSQRLARNLQLILQQEAQLLQPIDPAGGAWHVDKLTRQLARESWRCFQSIEARGGLSMALASGCLQDEIAAMADRRRQALNHGRSVLVGSSEYPDLAQDLPLNPPAEANLDDLPESAIVCQPLPAIRLARPFEQLRRHASAYRQQHGNLPRLLLLACADGKAGARSVADLREVLQLGGFVGIDGGVLDDVDQAVNLALREDPLALIICCQTGGELARDLGNLKARLPDLPLLLATELPARERKQIPGVDGYIAIAGDRCQLNRDLQRRLGVGA